MRKIITFLGKYPKQTAYEFEGQTYTGQVFAEALRQFAVFDEMLVFVTPEAQSDAWPVLEALDDKRIRPIPIPRGETTDEMWTIFDTIVAHVQEDETVLFDITHGLRSLPFLVFLFAAHLKFAKRVTIERIFYGALELGNPHNNKPAPVIDLSEFAAMLDWLTAASRFVETGEGQPLASLIRSQMPPGPQMGTDLEARELGQQLGHAARAIEDISLALRLTRPIEAIQASQALTLTLARTRPQVMRHARPFVALADRVTTEYGQFAQSEIEQPPQNHVVLTLEMVQWYVQRRHYVQAVTLAREWLVTLLAVQFSLPVDDLKVGREPVEDLLNRATARRQAHSRITEAGSMDERFEQWPNADEIAALWSELRELRNDIAHCGYRLDARLASRLRNDITALPTRLRTILTHLPN